MALTPVETMLLEALSAVVRGQRVHWDPLPGEQWAELFRLADRQKLLPLLVDAICECPGAEDAPAVLAARRAARLQVMRQTQQEAAFLSVYRLLRQAGIPALVVKGCVCRSVYPNGTLRISADEDLVTEPERFPEACRVLREAGLRAAPDADPDSSSEIGWRSPDGLLYLELHRYLFPPESGSFGALETVFPDLFSQARPYALGGDAAVDSLSPHDHMLFLLLHAMKHFIRTGFGLRQVCDIGLWALRWGAEIDWDLLREQTEQVRGARFAAAVFVLAARYLDLAPALPGRWREDAPDPEPMLLDLLDGGVYGSATDSRAHTAHITQDAVAAQRQGRRRSLRTALFPPAKELAGRYPVLKEHPGRLPLVWQKRLLRYLRESARSHEDSPAETLRLGRRRLELLREYGILSRTENP